MNYIIYDLEFTLNRRKQYLSEIIQIGAIKLQKIDGVLEMIDIFHSTVKPLRSSVISQETTKFTGITQDQINNSPHFRVVLDEFKSWLGSEEYFLCSWGADDKFQFIRQCHSNQLDLHWFKNYNDIQSQFSSLYKKDVYTQIGLKKALELLNIDFLGTPHNALDDAFNTAKIFKEVFPKLKLEINNMADEKLIFTKRVYQTGSEEFYPLRELGKLLAGQ